MDKTLKEVQKEVDDWANQFKEPYFLPLSRMAAMTEEVGEVARIINRMYGSKKAKPEETLVDLEEELGDLLFTLTCMANAEGVDLTKAFERKMDKVNNRDADRFEKKETQGKMHELKLCKQFYDAVANGKKTFEIRKNDRSFKVGDTVVLRAVTDDDTRAYIPELPNLIFEIGYIVVGWGVEEGYCVLAIKNLRKI